MVAEDERLLDLLAVRSEVARKDAVPDSRHLFDLWEKPELRQVAGNHDGIHAAFAERLQRLLKRRPGPKERLRVRITSGKLRSADMDVAQDPKPQQRRVST